MYIGLGSSFFVDNSIFIHPRHEITIDVEFGVPAFFKLLPFFCTIIFTILAITISEFFAKSLVSFKYNRFSYNLFSFFNQRFYIELFYNKFITGVILKMGGQTTKILDKGCVELIGPFGLEKGLLALGKNIAYLDTGVVTSYALYILMGLIFYLLVPMVYFIDSSIIILTLFSLFFFN